MSKVYYSSRPVNLIAYNKNAVDLPKNISMSLDEKIFLP